MNGLDLVWQSHWFEWHWSGTEKRKEKGNMKDGFEVGQICNFQFVIDGFCIAGFSGHQIWEIQIRCNMHARTWFVWAGYEYQYWKQDLRQIWPWNGVRTVFISENSDWLVRCDVCKTQIATCRWGMTGDSQTQELSCRNLKNWRWWDARNSDGIWRKKGKQSWRRTWGMGS